MPLGLIPEVGSASARFHKPHAPLSGRLSAIRPASAAPSIGCPISHGSEIELLRDGTVVERGHADNVLDGPLSALRHLVGLLARDPINLPLAIGDIVTTAP